MTEFLKDFPSYTWVGELSEKRKFSGSIGTGAYTGQFDSHIFNYKLWKKTVMETVEDKETEKAFLMVCCYIQPPRNSGGEIFGYEEKEYLFSEEAVADAKKWIAEQVGKYSDIIGK
ncbi:MAG: hypothetical protein HUJ76_08590 [Parasporobacterium sp.]|nr:hypothetical protein [Parasporobacterium sp.]